MRDELGEIVLTPRQREGDDARHVAPGKEAQKIDAAASDLLVAREGDHRNVGLTRDGRHGLDLLGEERPENELGALVHRGLGSGAGAARRSLRILRHEHDVRIVEVEQGKLGRLLQRLGDALRRSAGADRQKQRDLHRTGRAGNAWA